MIYFCSQKNRRALVLQHPTLNGIDYLEVAARSGGGCGKQLLITMLKDARRSLSGSGPGGDQRRPSNAQVQVVAVSPGTDAAPRVVTVQLNQSGDFSTYTLCTGGRPFRHWTLRRASIRSFRPWISRSRQAAPRLGTASPAIAARRHRTTEPDINYLAKDYGGFRQVMLDRHGRARARLDRNPPSDMGIALVEVLAYAADHLSYQQDAVGTEAYIGTARSRISLRRHAKLVDYQIGEGSNARVWVYLNVRK